MWLSRTGRRSPGPSGAGVADGRRRGGSELVGTGNQVLGAAAVAAPQPWPLARVVAVLVDVPVRAAGVPDGVAQGLAQLAVEALGGLAPNLDAPGPVAFELAQRRD